jgi:hypothetical protein
MVEWRGNFAVEKILTGDGVGIFIFFIYSLFK